MVVIVDDGSNVIWSVWVYGLRFSGGWRLCGVGCLRAGLGCCLAVLGLVFR